jgi:hypothetical protein
VTINKFHWIRRDLEELHVEMPKARKRYDKLNKRVVERLTRGNRIITDQGERDMLKLMQASRDTLRLARRQSSLTHARHDVSEDVAKDLIYSDHVFTLIGARVMYNAGWFATVTYVGKTFECRPNDASLINFISSSNRNPAEAFERMVTRLVERMAFNCGIA